MANKFDDLLEHFSSNSETLNETVIVDKRYLEEQKRKAKAWDNYLVDVENSVREVTGNEDEVKWHVDYVINEYMEEK
ncbi:hypothetical protein [Mammaliicoccus sp. E-M26]|uniref:hypothetical protein n=1 Tax=Mammaliicoccus sp. E-M26 TaxID=2898686 RepID=UPI001EFA5567|nr:hypothetical protein [Mammaliicoccus sp. E-M26]